MRGQFVLWSALLGSAALLQAAAPAPQTAEESLLSQHKAPTDGAGLLAYLRKRFAPVDEARVKRLIEQLGDDSFAQREEASRQLLLLGDRARKELQAALRHKDPEVRARAEACLRQTARENVGVNLLAAGVRVIGWKQPAGATEFLLERWPKVEDESLAAAVQSALADLAVRDQRANPVLVKALASDNAGTRRVAVVALCRGGARDQLPALRKLLQDPDREVRLATALGLVGPGMRDKQAVPALIGFMDQPMTGDTAMAEEVLFRIAGDRSPQLADNDAASRVKYRKAWQAWWLAASPAADLGALDARARPLGYTLVVMLDDNEILSLDAAGRTRWKFSGVEMPLDIQALPGDRVLLAEYKGNRVTERNSKGQVVWEKKVAAPLVAQRLANGNTFVATKESLAEYDRAGKEVATYPVPVGEVMRARKLPGGDVLVVTQVGTTRCYRIDRFGKTLNSFGVEVSTSGGRLDVNARGELLIPEMYNDRIRVIDRQGKGVREIKVAQPIAALALPGGNVLATSMSEMRAVEIDRAGKEVWQYKRATRVTRAVRY